MIPKSTNLKPKDDFFNPAHLIKPNESAESEYLVCFSGGELV